MDILERLRNWTSEVRRKPQPLADAIPMVQEAGDEIEALRNGLADKADLVAIALRRAWQLGQTYWQQADSDFISNHRKADETQAKFQALVDETKVAVVARSTED